MNKNLLLLLLIGFMLPFVSLAQNGKLSGVVTDRESKKPVPFAAIKVFSGGQFKGGDVANEDGEYNVSPLTPGSYTVEVSGFGYNKVLVTDVSIGSDKTTRFNQSIVSEAVELKEAEVVAYRVPLIDADGGGRTTLTDKDIAKLPSRDVRSVIATIPDAFSNDDGGDLNIRGQRGGDNIVYVNGRRQIGTSFPPVESIASISIITGGVPSQYGDALGGIVSVTTKGAAEKFRAGIQYETSKPFDSYNYNLYGANFTGPLLRVKKKDYKGKDSLRTLIGIYAAFTAQLEDDTRPSAYGYQKVKGDVLKRLEATPLRRLEDENGRAFYRAEADYLTPNDFDKIKARPVSGSTATQFNTTIDYQPSENILISLGGDYNYGGVRNINYGGIGQTGNTNNFNWFNSQNNNAGVSHEYDVFLRFRQSFPNLGKEGGFGLKNFYYQLQADYSRTFRQGEDPRFRNRTELYNYWGKFKERRSSVNAASVVPDNGKFFIYQPGSSRIVDSITVGTDRPGGTLPNNTQYIINGNTITQGLAGGFTYEPFVDAGVATNFNTQILGAEQNTNEIRTFTDLPRLGGLINGQSTTLGYGYGNFNYPGQLQSGYGFQDFEVTRFSGQVAGELRNHTLKVGFEYEQRASTTFGGAESTWNTARRLVNAHIINSINRGTSLSSFNTSFTPSGRRVVTIDPDLAVNTDTDGNILNQSAYDKRLRQILGVPVNQLINVEELDPSLLGLKNFTPGELLGDGQNSNVGYQGVNAYGEKLTRRPNYFDFYSDTINRPIDAFRPIYTAGYIEDKFEINDLILRVGLRIDQFDINQPVLRDKYSLTRLTLAGETDLSRFDNNTYKRPSTIGDDYAVYVDKSSENDPINNPGNFRIVGFRNENQFYSADGQEVNDYRALFPDNNVFPLYDLSRLNSPAERALQRTRGITYDAFRDFKPQTNVLPRLAFSFPISEDALFYAHYDILTQRPQGTIGNGRSGSISFDNYANPLQYFNLSRSNSAFLNNPDLLPQKKIDYQLGFQQVLSKRSALKISAFYSEIKDLIQVVNILGAYPNPTYRTNGNQDFGVVKGSTISYDIRKVKGVGFSANASYTLQFAEGSSSDFANQLLNTSTPNLRTIVAQNWDQRHTFKLNFDYHTGDGVGPEVFGSKIFSNAGVNITNFAGTGQPWTKDGSPQGGRGQIEGSINGSRLPFNNRTSLRIDKTWFFKGVTSNDESSLNIYFYAQNLFDQRNIINVNRRTGRPDDDGYLNSDFGKNEIAQSFSNFSPETFAYYYRQLLLDPNNVSIPRRLRIGLSYSF